MPSRQYRIIALLLALLVALVPFANAWASDHACEADGSANPMASTHATHGMTEADGAAAMDLPWQQDSCLECLSGCCNGGGCSANTCGGGFAAVTNGAHATPGLSTGDLAPSNPQAAPDERPSAPFRPPRV